MENVREHSKLPVLIIGAGSCGLALAQGLKKNKIPAIVFETDQCLQPEGRRTWTFTAHWSAPLLFSLIGEDKWSRIQVAQTDPNTNVEETENIPLHNALSGERLGELTFSKSYRLHRPRLRSLLAEGLDIRYRKTLVDITYPTDTSVTAHFEDGTAATGRLLVGADGAHSRTRSLLLGPERAAPKQLPYVGTWITARYTAAQALYLRSYHHPLMSIYLHPKDMQGMLILQDAPDPNRPEDWEFSLLLGRRVSAGASEQQTQTSTAEQLRRAKDVTRNFAEPLRSAFAWLPDDLTTVWHAKAQNWDPRVPGRAWDGRGGRITLAGDAAHPMTYHRGQGLNHAINDAWQLVEVLSAGGPGASGTTQAERVAAYELEMRARAGKEVKLSELNTVMLHSWSQVADSLLIRKGLVKSTEIAGGEIEVV